MIRFILLLVLVALGIAVAWYSAQSLPDWYQASDKSPQQRVTKQLSEQIKQRGVAGFLGDKFADVMNGQLILSQAEFNALLLASLESSKDGRRLLNVSEAVNAQIRDGELELGAVLNLDKVAQLDARSRQAVDKLTGALPFLDKSRMFLAVTGRPIARLGNIAFDDDFVIKIGSVPISSDLLSQLGVPVEKAASASLPIKYMTVKSIVLTDEKITLGVFPRF